MIQRKSASTPVFLLIGFSCLVVIGAGFAFNLMTTAQVAEVQTGQPMGGETEEDPAGPWRLIAPPLFAAKYDAKTIWTGEEMLIWEGVIPTASDSDWTNTKPRGMAYNPVVNKWREIAPPPLEPRLYESVVWTGSDMIVWGGFHAYPYQGEFANGAAYNPASDSWRSLSPSPLAARQNHLGAWTGQEMLISGGSIWESDGFGDSASYNPVSDRWSPAPSPANPLFQNGPVVFTGEEILVLDSAVAYNPATRSWRELQGPPNLPPASSYNAFWTNEVALMWGIARCEGMGCTPDMNGAIFDPASSTWKEMSSSGLPWATYDAVWTGEQMIVWGGIAPDRDMNGVESGGFTAGRSYVHVSDAWESLPPAPFNSNGNPLAVWTGSEMIVVDGTQAAAYKPQ